MSDTDLPNQTHAEQLSEGPGNGGIPKSATGKQGTKRKLDQKTIEFKYNVIIEFEKGYAPFTNPLRSVTFRNAPGNKPPLVTFLSVYEQQHRWTGQQCNCVKYFVHDNFV